MPDPSCVYDLHHSSWQHRILNPLSQARDQTRNLMVPSRICFRCTMMGTSKHSSDALFHLYSVPPEWELSQWNVFHSSALWTSAECPSLKCTLGRIPPTTEVNLLAVTEWNCTDAAFSYSNSVIECWSWRPPRSVIHPCCSSRRG